MHLQENTLYDLDNGVKVTQNVALYPLHHVTYAHHRDMHSLKLLRTPNGLGGDAFTRKFII